MPQHRAARIGPGIVAARLRRLRPAPWSPATRAVALAGGAALLTAAAGPSLPQSVFDAPLPAASAVAATLALPRPAGRPALPLAAPVPLPSAPVTSPAAATSPPHHPATRPARSWRHAHAAVSRADRRWVPSGVGIWIYDWAQTSGGNARAIVRWARAIGIDTLYLRTGSTWDGFTGTHSLSQLLAATHGTVLNVVVWDFPRLVNPRADALRLARAAVWGRSDRKWSRVRAVAPDIETPAEGTHMSRRTVDEYLWWLRHYLPSNVSILATVPWPSVYRIGVYPYDVVARFSDAFMPMAYWYDNSPTKVTASSILYLRRFGRPVLPIGQGYDSRVDAPGLPASHPSPELHQFVVTARRLGAPGLSLWSWQTARSVQWHALAWAHRAFPVRGG